MSVPPPARSHLHELVLALCVTGCLAVGLWPREVRREPPREGLEEDRPSATATATAEETRVEPPEIRSATDGTAPRAR